MATNYISKITLPSGTQYNIKDKEARDLIAELSGLETVKFKGVSTTPLTDGGTENPTVGGTVITAKSTGDLYFYGNTELIWGADSKWHALGDLSTLGDLAYADTASTSYQPAGTVSTPTFTGSSSNVTITATANPSGNYTPAGSVTGGAFTGSTTSFTGSYRPEGTITTTATTESKSLGVAPGLSGSVAYTPEGTVDTPIISLNTAGATTTIDEASPVTVAKTVVAVAPGGTAPSNNLTYYSVSNETLSLYQLGYTTGDSITTTSVEVKTGDATYTSSKPTFEGTAVYLETQEVDLPKSYSSTFSGTSATITTSGTPQGSNGAITFTGTPTQLAGTTTAAGSVSQPTFTGTATTITVEPDTV